MYLVDLTFASAVIWAEEINFGVIFVEDCYSLDVLIPTIDSLDKFDFSAAIKVDHFVIRTMRAFLDEEWRLLTV